MLALRLKWRDLAFAFAGMVLGLLALELAAGAYFYLEDRYWPRIPPPEPTENQSELTEYLAELERRRALPPEVNIPLQADEATGWSLRPNSFNAATGMRVNSLGLRGAEIGARQPGEVRLMFSGDSSIAGVGCPEEQTMSVTAAHELTTLLGRVVISANAGVPGFDSSSSLNQLQRLIPELHPDWVIIGNLWSDCYAVRAAPPEAPTATRRWVSKTSTYRLIRRLVRPFIKARKIGWFASREEMLQASRESARTQPDQYLANLLAMAEMARRAGARPLFLILPAPVDLGTDALPDIVVEYRSLMRQAAKESGAVLVDGTTLLAPYNVQIHHFVDAVHPGWEVHRLLGKAVAQAIAKELTGKTHDPQ